MQKTFLLFLVSVLVSCISKINHNNSELQINYGDNFFYTNISDSIPQDAFELNEQGKLLAGLQEYDKAIEYYSKAIEKYPQYVIAYHNRAISRRKQGDLNGAIKDYTKAIEFEPKYIYSYNNRGMCKKVQGDLKGALKDYNKAIEINPYYINAYINRGNVKSELKDYEGALRDYNKVIEIEPYDGDAYINRGVLKYEMGDYEGEIEDYKLCLAMAKETDNKVLIEEVSHNLGRALYDLKRFEEAAEAYSEGIIAAPENGQLYYGRGLSRNQSGDKEGACEDWRKSSALGCFEANVLLPLCEECETDD